MQPAPDVQLRLANLDDARGIAEVHVCTWQSAYREIIPDEVLDALSVEQRAGRWDEILRGGQTLNWIAAVDRRIVGFAGVGPGRDADAAAGSTGELYALYVSTGCWRQGVGQALCQRAFTSLVELGYREVTAWVLADNARARAFYERIGLRRDGAEKKESYGGRELREVRYRTGLDTAF
jgi:ribosomal protein S18 acetylase RimI-like enzyme